jgi:hypothetical protein
VLQPIFGAASASRSDSSERWSTTVEWRHGELAEQRYGLDSGSAECPLVVRDATIILSAEHR